MLHDSSNGKFLPIAIDIFSRVPSGTRVVIRSGAGDDAVRIDESAALERVDLRQQFVGVFQVVGLEVPVQQGERLGEGGGLMLHQRGEQLHRGREAGHPRVDGGGVAGGIVLVVEVMPGRVVVFAFAVQLEHPGVEPLPARDGVVELGMAAQRERMQPCGVEPLRRCAPVDVEHVRPPAAVGHAGRLHQHAALAPGQLAAARRGQDRVE